MEAGKYLDLIPKLNTIYEISKIVRNCEKIILIPPSKLQTNTFMNSWKTWLINPFRLNLSLNKTLISLLITSMKLSRKWDYSIQTHTEQHKHIQHAHMYIYTYSNAFTFMCSYVYGEIGEPFISPYKDWTWLELVSDRCKNERCYTGMVVHSYCPNLQLNSRSSRPP